MLFALQCHAVQVFKTVSLVVAELSTCQTYQLLNRARASLHA